ncbi:MAG: metallophosphoesterase family protein [Promethearchaeota archaeon]
MLQTWLYKILTYSPLDIIFFIFMPIIMLLTISFIIINYRFHLFKYKSTKILILILAPSAVSMSVLYYIEVWRYFHHETSLIYPILMEINVYSIFAGLIIALLILVIMFGKNWVRRRKSQFYNNFGPYLIMKRHPESSIKVCGRFSRGVWRRFNVSDGKKAGEFIIIFSQDYSSIVKLNKNTSEGSNLNITEEQIEDKENLRYKTINKGFRGFWNVELNNLKPNSKYYYLIRLKIRFKNDQNKKKMKILLRYLNTKLSFILGKVYFFETAKSLNVNEFEKENKKQLAKEGLMNATENEKSLKYSFIFLGDFHGGGHDISRLIRTLNEKYFTNYNNNNNVATVKNGGSDEKQIRFIIHGGDFVSDGRNLTHWKTLFRQLAPILSKVPILSCTGNHDANMPKMARFWKNIFPYDYINTDYGLFYYILYEEIFLLFLDLYHHYDQPIRSGKNTKNMINPEQIRLIEGVLKELPDYVKYKFMVLHEPMYSTSTRGSHKELERELMPLIINYGINSVLTSHVHFFELFHIESFENKEVNFTQVISGGGGGNLERAIFRKINKPPYLWEAPVHIASDRFFENGDRKSPLRNDEFIKKYQKIGFSRKHFVLIEVYSQEIKYFVYSDEGKLLFDYSQELRL